MLVMSSTSDAPSLTQRGKIEQRRIGVRPVEFEWGKRWGRENLTQRLT